MVAIPATARRISPLPGAILRPYDLGGPAKIGDSVYMAADGDVEQTSGGAAGTKKSIGVITAIGTEGALTGVAGDRVSVVRYGPVAGYTGITPGAPAYVSDTAGELADAAGTNSFVVGTGDADDAGRPIVFVNPPVA